MTVSAGFIDQVTELLQGLGHITVRRMFGGAAAYCDGTVFALLDEDCLYFKTDDAGRAAFEAEGMGPFSYETKNGPAQIASYYRVPERLMDDPEDLHVWARNAIAVGRREASARTTKARPKRASLKSKQSTR
jgi:DNA transformation protein